MKTILSTASAFAIVAFLGLSAVPASAADIDINLNVAGGGIIQTSVTNALSNLSASTDVAQIAGLGSIEGVSTDDINAIVGAGGVIQTAMASAVATGCEECGEGAANGVVTQVAGLLTATLTNVIDGSVINGAVTAGGIAQTAAVNAVGGAQAAANVNQLAGVGVVSVNVTP